MTLSGPSAAARLNINWETFFFNLILWSLYFRSFYFQEFVSSGVCLSGVCLSEVCLSGVCHGAEFCTQNTPNSVTCNKLIFGSCAIVYWLFVNNLNRNWT